MKKQKKGRRFVQKVKATTVPGIVMQVPDELKGEIRTRQPDSVARLVCPVCGAVRYWNQALMDHLKEVERVAREAIEDPAMQEAFRVGPRHTPCKAIFRILPLDEEQDERATTDKLAEALSLAGAPQDMIERALAGYYDDYKSPLPAPIVQLVADARSHGLPDIARRAMDGEFDATKQEGDEWAKSPEGQETFRQLLKGKE